MYTGIIKIAIILSLILVLVGPLEGVDALLIRGKVKSIDTFKGLIVVDVYSEGCRGERTFRVAGGIDEDLDDIIGKTLEFYIDTSVCEPGGVYSIISKPKGGKRP